MKKKWGRIKRIILRFADLFEPDGMGFKVTMFCPHCGSRLRYFGCKQYETLEDHVFDVNNHYGRPHRPAFACTKDGCRVNCKKGVYYDQKGGAYVEKYEAGQEYKSAIGSWEEWYNRHEWVRR